MESPRGIVARVMRSKVTLLLLLFIIVAFITTTMHSSIAVFSQPSLVKYGRAASDYVIQTSTPEPPATCKKRFDVSFLKVHKAGSTTIMNIFLRFAIVNNLNIVLPPRPSGYGFNYLGYGETLSKDRMVPRPANETYNILCNHVIYNKAAFRSVLPNDTEYIGILREPTSHFVSAASYYGLYKNLKHIATDLNYTRDVNIVSKFLQRPANFRTNTYYSHNKQAFDFGLRKEKFDDTRYIQRYIEELDRDYVLIMLMEQFPESLVLMKRLLCWSIKDILYVPLNAMRNKPDFHLSTDDINNLKSWNQADYMFYDHFRSVFKTKVEAQGEDFAAEVEHFKLVQSTVKQFCYNISAIRTSPPYEVPESRWDEQFDVTKVDCALMTEHELPMMSRLIKQAWQKYNASISS